jgi:hypothetical protein
LYFNRQCSLELEFKPLHNDAHTEIADRTVITQIADRAIRRALATNLFDVFVKLGDIRHISQQTLGSKQESIVIKASWPRYVDPQRQVKKQIAWKFPVQVPVPVRDRGHFSARCLLSVGH